MELTCHTESRLNASTLICLKMQLLVEVYNLLNVLNEVLKQVMAGLFVIQDVFLEVYIYLFLKSNTGGKKSEIWT